MARAALAALAATSCSRSPESGPPDSWYMAYFAVWSIEFTMTWSPLSMATTARHQGCIRIAAEAGSVSATLAIDGLELHLSARTCSEVHARVKSPHPSDGLKMLLLRARSPIS